MSWKCDLCDTYNEEASTLCFVCGQARSAESIAEAKRRLKEEKAEKIRSFFCEKCVFYLKIAFYASAGVSALAVLILLAIKIFNGQIGSVVTNLIDTFQHGFYRVTVRDFYNLGEVLERMLSSPKELFANVSELFGNCGDSLGDAGGKIKLLSQNAQYRINFSGEFRLLPILSEIPVKIKEFITAINEIIAQINNVIKSV